MTGITFSGQLTEAEFRTIHGLAARKFRWVIGVFVGIMSIWTYLTASNSDASLPIWIFLPLIYLVSMFVVPRFALRRQWRSNKLLHEPVSGEVNEEGIIWNVTGVLQMNVTWNLLLRYRESPSLVLVYQGLNQVFYFPRRYFANENDWAEFRKLIASKLPTK